MNCPIQLKLIDHKLFFKQCKALGLQRRRRTENENIWFSEKKINVERSGGKYFDEENIWSVREKKNGEGIGGNYLEKENLW